MYGATYTPVYPILSKYMCSVLKIVDCIVYGTSIFFNKGVVFGSRDRLYGNFFM